MGNQEQIREGSFPTSLSQVFWEVFGYLGFLSKFCHRCVFPSSQFAKLPQNIQEIPSKNQSLMTSSAKLNAVKKPGKICYKSSNLPKTLKNLQCKNPSRTACNHFFSVFYYYYFLFIYLFFTNQTKNPFILTQTIQSIFQNICGCHNHLLSNFWRK